MRESPEIKGLHSNKTSNLFHGESVGCVLHETEPRQGLSGLSSACPSREQMFCATAKKKKGTLKELT